MSKSIQGVEVFQAGTWNSDQYDVTDLDAMVDAFPKVGFSVPVKIGHTDDTAAPAYGWISRLYRRGKILLADLTQIPDELYAMIKEGRYRHVSAEIFWDIERDGQKYPRVLKGLALLGSAVPAVSHLKPIQASLAEIKGMFKTYVSKFRFAADPAYEDADQADDDDSHDDTREEPEMNHQAHIDPGGKLHQLAQQFLSLHPTATYKEALRSVRATPAGQELMCHYIGQGAGFRYQSMTVCQACKSAAACKKAGECAIAAKGNENAYTSADQEVMVEVGKYMAAHPEIKSYGQATKLVLAEKPELALAYAKTVGSRL